MTDTLTLERPDVLTEVRVDLHGYHPDEITGWPLEQLVEQAWEIGADRLRLVHGHGRHRPTAVRGESARYFNTGFLGLRIRNELEQPSREVRRYIRRLDRALPGSTSVWLRPNPEPTRDDLDLSVLPRPADSRFLRGW